MAKIVNAIKENLKLIIIGIIAIIIFNKYAVLIILMLFFTLVGIWSMQISRVVPHINIETITASAVLIGYIWDWKIGFAFGTVAAMLGWIRIGLIKHTTITVSILSGLAGVLGAFFGPHGLSYGFFTAFLLSILVRTIVTWFVMGQITSDPIENFMHSWVEGFFTIAVYSQFMNIIYIIISPLV